MDCAVQDLKSSKEQVSTVCRMVDGDHGGRTRAASHHAVGFPPESPGRRTMAAHVSIASPRASVWDLLLSHSRGAGKSRSEMRGRIVAASGKDCGRQRPGLAIILI